MKKLTAIMGVAVTASAVMTLGQNAANAYTSAPFNSYAS